MNWTILWSSAAPIPLHAMTALLAMTLGATQFLLPKGGLRHRVIGWMFVALMTTVSVSALWIHDLRLVGPWSPIHLLIPVTLLGLWSTVRHARAGRIKEHKRGVLSLYLLALIVTGAFTLLPGRVMHSVIFG